jgi:hypothetical protein
VTCLVLGTDTVTHASLSAEPIRPGVLKVSGITRMYFNVTSDTYDTAHVGQRFTVMAVYGNRGNTTITNIGVICGQSNHGFSVALKRQTRTSLPPGQSGFAEFVAVGGLVGAGSFIRCSLTAVDGINVFGLSSTPFVVNIVP